MLHMHMFNNIIFLTFLSMEDGLVVRSPHGFALSGLAAMVFIEEFCQTYKLFLCFWIYFLLLTFGFIWFFCCSVAVPPRQDGDGQPDVHALPPLPLVDF